MRSKKLPLCPRFAVGASVLLWLCGVAGGLWLLWSYAARPGLAANAPATWPEASQIQRAPGLPTLVMLAHPRCPCSRASIGELAVLMARCEGKVDAHVLFMKPQGVSRDWHETDLWRSCAAIPGARVICDEDGSEGRRFGAATSGQTLLYARDGRLLFNGGITGARGHAGDNAGLDGVVAHIRNESSEHRGGFVFGCPLLDPQSRRASVR